ncbi:MAG: TlpA disulfide reductase family protein [Myxococcota bacterium]
MLVFSGCITPGPNLTGGERGAAGREQPLDFTLPRLDGTAYSLKSDRGSVVLLDVWATWCDPCRDALPLYQDLLKEYGARGLKVYAISVDTDTKMIPPFLAETKVDLPVLLDPAAAFAEATLKVKVMPTAFLIDRKGVLRVTHEGFDEGLLATWVKDIEGLLAEPAP